MSLMQRKSEGRAWAVIAVGVALLVFMNWQRRNTDGIFPQRAVTLICPFSPGGGTDLLARVLAHEAEKRFGRPVLVSNITGGGGAIGHAAGRIAPADGHTVLLTTFELVSLPVQGLAPFTYRDFDLLMLLNMDPAAIAVRADYAADSLAEFLRNARQGKQPSIGNSGAGAVWHLAAAMLADRAQVPVTHVPFNGASQAITALIGGHIDAVTVSPAELKTYVESGQIKLLGIMSSTRLKSFPETPTCREQDLDLVFGTWRGLALPAGVPSATRDILRDTFNEVAQSDELAAFAAQSGMNFHLLSGEDFLEMVDQQAKEVAATMKKLGLVK